MSAASYTLKWGVRAVSNRSLPGLFHFPRPVLVPATGANLRNLSSTPRRRSKKQPAEEDDEDHLEGPYKEFYLDYKKISEAKMDSLHDAVTLVTTPEELAALKAKGYDEERAMSTSGAVRGVRNEYREADKRANTWKPIPVLFQEDKEEPEQDLEEDIRDDVEWDRTMLSLGQAKLEEHMNLREYARIAIWEMPLLSKLAKPFEPPSRAQPLRWRYTSYMGEYHPAEKKVVVELCPMDLDLTEAQQHKLRVLAGTRYNPEKDTIKMSCEMFEHQAQNKRYLGDLVGKLIAEAKDPTDTFKDVPVDTRHHTFKVKPKFPKEWRMSEERQKQLAEIRQQSYCLDETKKAEGKLVDGREEIRAALEAPTLKEGSIESRVAELLTMNVRQRGGPSVRGHR